MTSNDLVSVVIPVYNVERYLERCIQSIVTQTYKNIEIILVDDESPDGCPEMCDSWAKQDSRIIVIHKKNAGLGMARNSGIACASGKYICFVDGDDYVLPNMIERAVATAEIEQADIVMYGFITVDLEGNKTVILPHPSQNVYVAQEVRDIFLPDYIAPDPETGIDSGIPGSACASLISMQLIRNANWRFASERDVIMEDVYSIMHLCQYVSKIAVISESFYCYCSNPASLSQSYRQDRFQKMKQCYQSFMDLCVKCGYSETVKARCAEAFLGGTIAAMKQTVRHCQNVNVGMKQIRQIADDRLLQQILIQNKGVNRNYKKKVLYWAITHKCYLLCYLLLYVKAKNARK